VHSTGFRLSVCATAGLLVGVRPIARRLPGPRWVAEPLATTLAAQVATAPLLVTLAGGVPPVAILANLLAVPAAGLVMMLGLSTGLAAGLLSAPVALVLNWPTGVLVRWVATVAAVASSVPLPLLDPSRLALVVGAVALVALARRWGLPRWSRVAAGSLALVALAPAVTPDGVTTVAPGVVLQVGECGERWVSLHGPRNAVDALEALRDAGVTTADVVVARPADGAVAAAVAEQLRAVRQAPGSSGSPCSVSP
jgi:competence protein ComEC